MVEARRGEGGASKAHRGLLADGAGGLTRPDDAACREIADEVGGGLPRLVGEDVVETGAGQDGALRDLLPAHGVDDPVTDAEVAHGALAAAGVGVVEVEDLGQRGLGVEADAARSPELLVRHLGANRLGEAPRVMPGEGGRAGAALCIEQRACLGHAGDADAADDRCRRDAGIVQGSVGDRHRQAGEVVGVDVGAGAVVAPRRRSLGLAPYLTVEAHRERLHARGPHVDADEQLERVRHGQRAASGASGAGGRHATAITAPSAVQSPAA